MLLINTLLPALLILGRGVLALPEARPEGVEARSCTNVGCYCQGAHQGQYCGYCAQVLGNWVSNNVYECSPSGACCDYGYRASCANGQGPCG